MHITAAAVTHIKPIILASAENRNGFALFQGKNAPVFEHDNTLTAHAADQFRHVRGDVAVRYDSIFFLHQTVSANQICNTLGSAIENSFDLTHNVISFKEDFGTEHNTSG
jgi:hypothetical protein